MKKGTRIGWILVAVSIVLSVWVIASPKTDADITVGDFILSDDSTTLISYAGAGGAAVVPDTVTTISASAFANSAITSVTVPASVTNIGDGAFYNCSSLSSVDVAGPVAIPASAFYGCASLSSVNIPNATYIGDNAFGACSSLGTITIPAACTSISSNAFDGCVSMSSIEVAGGSASFVSYDGCLYNAGGTNLLIVPKGKAAVSNIPASCIAIADNALSGTPSLTYLYIPKTVTSISRTQSGLNSGLVIYYDPVASGEADSEAVNFAGDLQAAGLITTPAVPIGSTPTPGDSFTVTFDSQGGTAVDAQLVASGAVAARPVNPTKAGYNFTGWFTDAACTSAYNFATP